jgi:phosphoribosylglycinamide formyltransferase-1
MANGKRTRVGVILSAGGSAFAEAARIASSLRLDFCAVTDRECGAEARCRELAIPVTRIVEPDRNRFSRAANDHFAQFGAQAVLLHFSRLIGPELFRSIPCCNVHPSLLPAFPGMGSVKQAWASGARILGATLHVVDETVDGGRIIAQTADPIPTNADLAWCERLSFVQKTYLTLVLFELLSGERLRASAGGHSSALSGSRNAASPNPTLTSDVLIKGFESLRLNTVNQGGARVDGLF